VKLIVAKKAACEPARPPEPTIVRRLLAWAQRAEPGERAEAASALARAYRYSDLPEDLRREAAIGLTVMLDDSSTLVRRALAEAIASAHDAPHHIISALAADMPEIATIVVAVSPVLSDAELVDCAAIGDGSVQTAIARRPYLGAGVAAAVAEIGRRQAVIALVENDDARLTPVVLRRIVERFGEDGEAREALLSRPRLPATLRCELVASAAKALSPFAAAFGLGAERIERMMNEGREEGAISIATFSERQELADLVRHLRSKGALTAALLMRALVSGNRRFFLAAGAELSGLAFERVAGFVREPFGSGFAALHRRMGLPMHFLSPFRVALAALDEFEADGADRALRPVVARVIAACEAAGSPDLARLLSLLRRLEAEAALVEARIYAGDIAAERAAFNAMLAGEWPAPAILIEPADRIGAPALDAEAVDAWPEPAVLTESVNETTIDALELVASPAIGEGAEAPAPSRPVFDVFKALDEEFGEDEASLTRFAA
jgi:uncharacterized protein (DUF2336 family)